MMVYLIRWFNGVKEESEIYGEMSPDDLSYVRETAEDFVETDINSLIEYQDVNGNYPTLRYVSIEELAETARDLAYPFDDVDYMVDKLNIKVRDEYRDYYDKKGIVSAYIEEIKSKIYAILG